MQSQCAAASSAAEGDTVHWRGALGELGARMERQQDCTEGMCACDRSWLNCVMLQVEEKKARLRVASGGEKKKKGK